MEILAQAMKTFECIRPTATLGQFSGSEKTADADIVSGRVAELQEILNISQLEVRTGDVSDVVVSRAGGLKCERCWHWELQIGRDPANPGLCDRCVDAIGCNSAPFAGNVG